MKELDKIGGQPIISLPGDRLPLEDRDIKSLFMIYLAIFYHKAFSGSKGCSLLIKKRREILMRFDTIQEYFAVERAHHDIIKTKRMYVDITGDIVTAILLNQILYWFSPNEDGSSKLRVKKNGKYWLAKTRYEWWDEIRITVKQYKRAIKILEEMGLIEKKIFKFNGAPTTHIRINTDKFLKMVNDYLNPSPDDSPAGKNDDDPYGDMEWDETSQRKSTKGTNGMGQNVPNINIDYYRDHVKVYNNSPELSTGKNCNLSADAQEQKNVVDNPTDKNSKSENLKPENKSEKPKQENPKPEISNTDTETEKLQETESSQTQKTDTKEKSESEDLQKSEEQQPEDPQKSEEQQKTESLMLNSEALNYSQKIATILADQIDYEKAGIWVNYIESNLDAIKNPSGYFRTAVEQEWPLPDCYAKKIKAKKREQERRKKEEAEKKRKAEEEEKFKRWCAEQPEDIIERAEQLAEQEMDKQFRQPKTETIRQKMLNGFKKQFLQKWHDMGLQGGGMEPASP